MVDGHGGPNKKFDFNQMIEHYFLRLMSRGMIVIGFPIIIWAASHVWDSFDRQLEDIQLGISAVQEQQSVIFEDMDDLTDGLADAENKINSLDEIHLTPFKHFKEHQNKRNWFNVTDPE